MATLFVDKIDPQSGTSLTIGSSGDTITIPSGATITNSGTANNFGGANTPNFFVTANTSQNIANATTTIVPYNTVVYDTASAFGSNGFTVPSGQGGKYYFFARLMGQFWDASGEYADLSIFEGSTQKIVKRNGGYNAGGDFSNEITGVVNVSAGTLITIKIYHTMGQARGFDTNTNFTYFGGFKIIE